MTMANEQQKVTLDDIVFENRNKEYGAYFLRKNYARFLNRAVFIGVGVFTLVFGGAWTYQKYIIPNLPAEEKSVDIVLDDLPPKKEDEPLNVPPPPPPPPPPPAPEVAQIKFLPPEPKKDEEVVIEEPPPRLEEIENKVISNKSVEGVDALSAFTPPPAPPAEITKPVELERPAEEDIFTSVEQYPAFPGGQAEMYKFINSRINYPPTAQRNSIEGKVFVKFVVERDGSIGAVEVQKGIGFGCDEETIRVIKSMPKWNPGRQNGKNVRVYFNIPVFFKLD